MVKFKNYSKKFLRDDEGMELIEWGVIVALVIGLVSVVAGIISTMKGSLEDTQSTLETELTNAKDTASGGSGGGGGGSTETA